MATASNSNVDEVIQLKPSEMTQLVDQCLLSPAAKALPPLIYGGIGIGKSSIVKQAYLRQRERLLAYDRKSNPNAEPRYGYIELRTATMEPTDVVGVPMPDIERQLTKWFLPEWLALLPRDWQGVVFMDEFTKALPSVTNAWSQPILDRHINGHPLPDGLRFVLAGNRRADKSGDVDLGMFMYNRVMQVELVPDVDDLCSYFKAIGVRNDLIGFLKFSQENMYNVQADKKVNATPRTWEMAAHVMDECEALNTPDTIRQAMIVGLVGKGPGFAYLSFYKMFSQIPPIDSVIADPMGSPVFKEMSVAYALALCLARKAAPSNLDNIMKYLNRGPVEITAVFMNDATQRTPELKNSRLYIDWIAKHQNLET